MRVQKTNRSVRRSPPVPTLSCGTRGRSALQRASPFRISADLTMTRQVSLFCARLLISAQKVPARASSDLGKLFDNLAKVSNVDQLFPRQQSDHDGGERTSSLSFRFSELSQPI